MNFLGVMADENMTWKTHVELMGYKISKSIEILFRKQKQAARIKLVKDILFSSRLLMKQLNILNEGDMVMLTR